MPSVEVTQCECMSGRYSNTITHVNDIFGFGFGYYILYFQYEFRYKFLFFHETGDPTREVSRTWLQHEELLFKSLYSSIFEVCTFNWQGKIVKMKVCIVWITHISLYYLRTHVIYSFLSVHGRNVTVLQTDVDEIKITLLKKIVHYSSDHKN